MRLTMSGIPNLTGWNSEEHILKTRTKILIAHLVYKTLSLFGVSPKRVISRNGVKYEVDLAEGIDLSLFLTGSFQKHVSRSTHYKLPDDAVIIDVGANIGSVCLHFPLRYPDSMVYAVEPSEFAMRKLKRNIELNPTIQNRIVPSQYFVSSTSCESSVRSMSASWQIDDLHRPNRHPVHFGIQTTETVETITLDDFIGINALEKLDFIKIDTDGHELPVLEGASNVLRLLRPVVVFEMMSCTLDESPDEFKRCERILLDHEYVLYDAVTEKPVTSVTILDFVPKAGSTDILAIPKEQVSS